MVYSLTGVDAYCLGIQRWAGITSMIRPYTYFSSDDLHLGEISLECSRAGAAAAGLWATLQVFGLEPMGRMGQVMQYCRKAAVRFADAAVATGRFVMLEAPELDIVVYAGVPEVGARTLRGVSAVSERVFRRGMERGADGVYVSLYTVPCESGTQCNARSAARCRNGNGTSQCTHETGAPGFCARTGAPARIIVIDSTLRNFSQQPQISTLQD